MFLSESFIDRYRGREPEWGFNGLGRIVFKRTYARPVPAEGRTEEWWETVRRVVEGAQAIGAGLTEAEAERLYDHMFHLRGVLGGRMLWQLGTENNNRIGGDSLVNCWFVDLQRPEDFSWLFERLMLGGGVGFSVTNPQRLGVPQPTIVEHRPGEADVSFIVPDNREGWAELVERILKAFLRPADGRVRTFTYSTDLVRPEGAPIKTFGGTASGPGILIEGVETIAAVLSAAAEEGRHLTSTDVLDIANVIGSIVVSGNVRRSAQIALGDPLDLEYLKAKRWDLGDVPNHRAMSNNSVYLSDGKDLPEEFWAGYEGNGEPYGLFNLSTSRLYGRTGEVREDESIVGTNPCAEIPLANRESCNLAEIFLPRITSLGQLEDVASLLYKVQKAVAALPYLDAESDAITSANMRLGLGVTGVAQATEEQLGWLSPTYNYLRELDRTWSAARGWPESVRLTTVKPSGTLSLLAGVTPGVHPAFSTFHIRRVRMAANDSLVDYCRRAGYPVEPVRKFDGTEDPRTVVVEFPCKFPETALTAAQTDAITQLELQARLQRDWADNAVSVTVYYKPEELPTIKSYLAANWREMKSVSFLPAEDHGFDQAPLEAITQAEYRERLERLVEAYLEETGELHDLGDDECATGACPVR